MNENNNQVNPNNGMMGQPNMGVNPNNGMMNQPNMGANPNNGMMNQPNMGVNPNNGMMNQPNMGVNPNTGMMNQPNMGVNPNNGMMNQPNMGVNPNNGMMGQPKGKSKKGLIIGLSVGAVLLVAVIVAVVLLFGGKSKLVCTQTESAANGITMKNVVEFTFKGKSANSAKAVMEVDLGNHAALKDTFIETLEGQYQTFEEQGIDIEITSDDTKVYVTLNVSKDKMQNADLTSFETYEDIKKDMEQQGFTCK